MIIEDAQDTPRYYSLIESNNMTRRAKYFQKTENKGSHTSAVPVSCARVRSTNSDVERITLICIGPQRHTPQKLPQTFWDDLLSLGGEWMWNSLSFDTDDSLDLLLSSYKHGTLLWVTDGSYNAKTAPDTCGAGWIACDPTSSR